MESDARIDILFDRWEEMKERATPVSIDELCAHCPELAGALRRRIEVLGKMDSVLNTDVSKPGSEWVDQDRNRREVTIGLPVELTATAVLRPRRHHAQGGLGEVLAADQEELNRPVAVKRVRPDKLGDATRSRFLREAAITARLQHPGIVPIYGLGRDENGPFYIMPFIEGRTLQEAIDELHSDESARDEAARRGLRLRALLQHFITVCNTIAYAHDQGVIHRDLKPSNIMLGPYGETLVMDWGLAKRFGGEDAASDLDGGAPSPSPSPPDLTASGTVMGTPRYMSPEQAKGEPAGPPSDIFNLGLVLYAILTGKSAFADDSFRGADALRAVREAEIVPPRSRVPQLPRALEAVCLKALAERPERRYGSPRQLASDIENWLADERISAWREPLSARVRRWARRHRTAVTGAVAALVVGVIGLTAVAVLQSRARTALESALSETTNAKRDAEKALAQKDSALADSEMSRKRVESVLTFLRNDVLAAP
jgi:eukaryotic-like serine/threonine-protein kinase